MLNSEAAAKIFISTHVFYRFDKSNANENDKNIEPLKEANCYSLN